MIRLATILAASLLAIGPIAGCGDDDEGEETPATTTAPTGSTGATGAGGNEVAEDADAKSNARSAQVVLETYATDNNGSYEGATPNNLSEIQPVESDIGLETTADTYSITADSESGNTFTVERSADGKTEYTCTEAGVGGCDENGEW